MTIEVTRYDVCVSTPDRPKGSHYIVKPGEVLTIEGVEQRDVVLWARDRRTIPGVITTP